MQCNDIPCNSYFSRVTLIFRVNKLITVDPENRILLRVFGPDSLQQCRIDSNTGYYCSIGYNTA